VTLTSGDKRRFRRKSIVKKRKHRDENNISTRSSQSSISEFNNQITKLK